MELRPLQAADARPIVQLRLANREYLAWTEPDRDDRVDRQRAGRGLATAAVAAILEVAWRDLGLHRVEAETRVDNPASQRVLEKNGFRQVGLLRRHLLIGGDWVDHLLWEKLEDD